MVNITLSVPPDLKVEMDRFGWVNWSDFVRTSIKARLRQLELMDLLAAKSRLTDADVEELGRKVKKGIARHYKPKN